MQIDFLQGAVTRSSTWQQEARARSFTAAGHAMNALSNVCFALSFVALSERCLKHHGPGQAPHQAERRRLQASPSAWFAKAAKP